MFKLGNLFDGMTIENNRIQSLPLDYNYQKKKVITKSWVFYLFLSLVFLPILIRLFYLQILSSEKYRQLADENRIRQQKIPAMRGIIYDRNHRPLVYNSPIYRKKDQKTGKFPIISRQEALLMEGKGETDSLLVFPTRDYLYKEATAHLLGYIGEISKEEMEKDDLCKGISFKAGDFIGKNGIEKSYECFLKGADGAKIIEVDTFGKTLREIGRKEPVAGNDLVLSIDLDLQLAVAKEMIGKKGAVVVSDPINGEILALYSSPSFNPNVFTKEAGEKEDEAAQLLTNNQDSPLIDRAIAGVYPSGSVFKIITATAGLEDKKIIGSTLLEDTGVLKVGQWEFPNWLYLKKGEKEGFINLVHAIKRSNDVYFYRLGERVGIDRLNFWARKFGLGKPLGIDLPGELGGIVPDDDWKIKTIGENWYLGDTYHLAIGQGYLLVTPLQVNTWTAAIASGSKFWTPHLVKVQSAKCKVQSDNSKIKNDTKCHPERPKGVEGSPYDLKLTDLKLNEETIRLITEGMRQACETGGTAWPLFDFKVKQNSRSPGLNVSNPGDRPDWRKISLACKTGTAEFGDPKNDTHAWFTAFAPVENPEIVVTVLVERGGEGSDVAAPIAKKILEEWFKEK